MYLCGVWNRSSCTMGSLLKTSEVLNRLAIFSYIDIQKSRGLHTVRDVGSSKSQTKLTERIIEKLHLAIDSL